MGDFNRTMNFAFGCSNTEEDFDPLNNRFFEIIVYRMSTGEKLSLASEYDIRRCSAQELNVINNNKKDWYPRALCFKKRDQVVFEGNWLMKEYAFPTVAIVKCEETANSTKKCANETEFIDFIDRN